MSTNKSKKLLKTIFKHNSSCGCGKPKLSDVFEPTPRPKISIDQNLDRRPAADSSSSSSCRGRNDTVSTTDDTTIEVSSSSSSHNSFPSEDHNEHQPQKKNSSSLEKITSKKSNINDNCIAVVKDSDDPFEDFKQSMKQMILEREIYEKKDLQELLRCFLELNSPSHRDIIVQAFTEIWNDVVAKKLLVSDQTTSLEKTGGGGGGGGGNSCLDCCARAKAM